MLSKTNDSRLAGLFTGKAVARFTIRREILYWRERQRSVLPSDMPGADGKREKRTLLFDCRGGGRGGISPLFAVPAGSVPGNSSVVRNVEHGFTSAEADRRNRIGGRRRGGAGGASGCWFAASSAAISETSRSNANSGGAHSAAAFCEETYRRDEFADEPGRHRVRLRVRSKI